MSEDLSTTALSARQEARPLHIVRAQPVPFSVEELAAILRYNPVTGELRWKVRAGPRGPGDLAGCLYPNHIKVFLSGRLYRAHRLIYYMMTGEQPPEEIDHINGVGTDNRWINLRAATHQQNMRNRRVAAHNTSGTTGVSWNKKAKKWEAYVSVGLKMVHLGHFHTIEEAIAARRGAEVEAYGEFSPLVCRGCVA